MRTAQIRLMKDGRERIHYFVHDFTGLVDDGGPVPPSLRRTLMGGGTPGYIACNPKEKAQSRFEGDKIIMVKHTDEVRAVTCPECLATAEAQAQFAALLELLPTDGAPAGN